MTTVTGLLSQLGAAGIRVWLDEENQLRFKAPKGALTPELKEQLLSHKENVIAFLQQSRAGIAERIDPVARNAEQRYPLSYAQQRFWFLDRFEPGNAALHIPAAIRIRGALDISRLQQAIEQLVARHETLRTTLVFADNQTALQQIHAPFAWPLSIDYDLSHLPAAEQQAHLHQLMAEEALKPFDLYAHNSHSQQDQPSLMRTTLVCLQGTNDHVLLLTLHHIIADGWSLGLLIRELTEAYRTEATPRLSTLPLGYIDFSAWQQQWLQNHQKEHLDFWQQQLQGLPLLELPTDFARPKQLTHHGASCHFAITPGLAGQVQALALQQQVSAFVVWLSAFKVLLHRYSQQDDICVGTPVAGRKHRELEGIIGCFINLLAIRSPLGGELSFTRLLEQVQGTLLQAQEHQDIPFELVADACTGQRSLAHTPIFQVLFTHQTDDLQQQLQVEGLQFEVLEQPSLTSKYDLQLHIGQLGGQLHGTIEFNRDLFEPSTIEAMAQHYVRLLELLLAQPDAAIESLNFLSAEEYALQMDCTPGQGGWNATAHQYPAANALHELIQAQVAATPEALAVADAQGTLSYAELNRAANRLAHHLMALGVTRNTPVAVCLERSTGMSVALLAILKAGGCYVPLATDIPLERLRYIVQDTRAKVFISSSAIDIGDDIACPRLLIGEPSAWAHCPDNNPPVINQGNDTLNIIYTSGSTGNPKGVMVPHQGIINRLQWMQHEYRLTPADRIAQKTPYNFDVSVWELFWPLLTGSSIHYAKPEGHKDPEYLRNFIIDNGITVLHFVPSMLGLFLQTANIEHCTSIKKVFTSGEALQLPHNEGFFARLPQAELHNLYGPTEASIDVSYYACHPHETLRSVPIGKPIHNTQLHIFDKHLQPLPVGAAGELYIGGIGLANGYWNQPELTASAFIDNPYHAQGHPSQKLYKTGDVARYLPDGNIEYLGRNDHQVKIRGFRIELGEIETRLRQLPAVTDCVVVSRSVNGSAQLVAYVVAKDTLPEASALNAELKQHLPDYMLPAFYVALEQLPLSANGKIDRKQLPEVNAADLPQREYVAPRNATETTLAGLWQALLGLERVGVHDNFFELGGHSLLAAQLLTRIRDTFHIDLPLRTLFEVTTIEGLARIIAAMTFATDIASDVLDDDDFEEGVL